MDLNGYAKQCHEDNMRWWLDENGNKKERNKGELIALMHSELSECLEGVRKNLPSDHIPMSMEEEELADVLIRLFDYAGAYGLDLQAAYDWKREYNAHRSDHTHEARAGQHGKRF